MRINEHEWFEGPWIVIEKNELVGHPRLKDGEIMRHNTGLTLLNCPACGSLQFTVVKVTGDDNCPTLTGKVKCGSGFCKRCGVDFTIVNGRTAE